jgi:hypothetical protein
MPFQKNNQIKAKKILMTIGLTEIALLLNMRRDVALLHLYKKRGFTHVPPKPKICCM